MEIKNFGDLRRAILSGKKIRMVRNCDYTTKTKIEELKDNYELIHWTSYMSFETKPEKEYVPFTADDWREFCNLVIGKHSDPEVVCFTIIKWDRVGVYLNSSSSEYEFINYRELCDWWHYNNNKPCSKEVIK